MPTVELILPPNFDDYAWEVEAKGVYWLAKVRTDKQTFAVTFYEPVRLRQDVEAELEDGRPMAIRNLIVVDSVTKANMYSAVQELTNELFT